MKASILVFSIWLLGFINLHGQHFIDSDGRLCFQSKIDTLEGYILFSKDTVKTELIKGYMTYKPNFVSYENSAFSYYDEKWQPIRFLILQFYKHEE